MTQVSFKKFLRYLGIGVLIAVTCVGIATLSMTGSERVQAQSSVRPPAGATTTVQPGSLPTTVAPGVVPRADMWRSVRQGIAGRITIPDQKAAVLVQSEGENFRAFRNGPLSVWGGWLLLAAVIVIAAFFAYRGRIKIEEGPVGVTVQRFNFTERFTHWLTAISFIVLALTGLNVLYGRYVLLPIIGASAFSLITIWGKYAHNYIAFAFMLGLVVTFVIWVRYNIPSWTDVKWLAKGGGLFVKGSHPPADRFNAGQKFIFWAVILGGLSISLSGISLLLPFEFNLFAPTFKVLNIFGLGLPTELTTLQETQLALLWHAVVALILIAIIIGHIYIGTIGMEGALDAMTTGNVDRNWVREHHSLWLEKIEGKSDPHQQMHPAE